MRSPTRQLARFVLGLQYGEWPAGVTAHTKLCVADALACCLGGSGLPWTQSAVRWVTKMDAAQEATIWADGRRTVPHEAAFANGVGAHSILQEDMHITTYTHPGSVVIPAALAVSEAIGASGKEFLTAVVAGYEAMLRVGVALHTKQFEATGLRPSGFFGPFGAAAAAGHLLGLNEDQLVAAFGLAGNMAAGVRQWGAEGTTDVFVQNGNAARSGVMAAYLAQDGLTGPEHVLEGRGGLAPSISGPDCRWEVITKPPGDRWEIETVYFKPVPGCGAIQTLAQMALRLGIEQDLRADDVLEGVIYTHLHGKQTPGLDYGGPFDALSQAQMSNQFAASVAIVDRDISFYAYSRFDRAEIAQLASRLRVEVDPDIQERYPAKKGSRIELLLRDGRRIAAAQEDTLLPNADEVYAKLRTLAQSVCGAAGAMHLEKLVRELEEIPLVKVLALATTPK
jgi:2-methylcitrate dehydratase PrpD